MTNSDSTVVQQALERCIVIHKAIQTNTLPKLRLGLFYPSLDYNGILTGHPFQSHNNNDRIYVMSVTTAPSPT